MTRKRIEEQRRIKDSVGKELRELEKKLANKREDTRKLDELREQKEAQIADLERKIRERETESTTKLLKLQSDIREAESTELF